MVKLGVFLVFGAILTFDALFADGWAAVAIVAFTLVWRAPWPCSSRWPGSRSVDTPGKAFMAWFGPKGVATMTFALARARRGSRRAAEQIVEIAALTCSSRSSPTV